MNKKMKIFIYSGFFCAFFSAGAANKASAATITAASCSYADVNYAVNTLASRGDTVLVPSGTCTWSSRLDITKAIKLIGAGRDTGGTKIYFAYGVEGTDRCGDCPINYAGAGGWGSIKFKPSNPQLDENVEFVVTGFDFNEDPSVVRAGGILILNCSVDYPLRKVKIYNNDFNWRLDSGSIRYALFLNFQGYVYGTAYDNVFDGRHPYFYMGGGNSIDATLTATGNYPGDGCTWPLGKHQWEKRTHISGSSDTFVLEDNILHFRDMSGVHFGGAGLGGTGYVVRYNSLYFYDADREYQNGWQVHGAYNNQFGGSGLEVYGNYFYGTSISPYYSQSVMFCRAGRCMGWGNLFAAAGNQYAPHVEIHHECMESLCNLSTTHACSGGTKYDGALKCASDGQPQHPFNSYFFKNFYGSTGSTLANNYSLSAGPGLPSESMCGDALLPEPIRPSGCDDLDCSTPSNEGGCCQFYYHTKWGTLPRRNTDFWGHEPSNCNSSPLNNCTSGVGCGSTLPASCTKGTGYWLTTEPATCSQLTMTKVGAGGNPSTKKQAGALYRCESTNNWKVYYTPLTYPHPLRGGTTANTAPAAPTGVRVI